jgi:ubiquinone/menaquinone biosynthesis C-methylase UbiE
MSKEAAIVAQIKNYYLESESAYRNWGKDEEREGIYALHGGFAIEGQNLSHYEEVKELTRQLLKFAQIPSNLTVLDAGCGAGALTFELATNQPGLKIVGINIAHNQLVSAENYRCEAAFSNVFFSEQDYHRLAFPDETFDVVVFCESFIHSYNKTYLAQEIYRVLKTGGRIVLSDTFAERVPRNEKEAVVLEDLMEGWYLPSILKIEELESVWKEIGFQDVFYENHTQNIIGSSRGIREHAELRINQGNRGSEVLKLSRRAAVACNEALEIGLTGYYFVKGYKS